MIALRANQRLTAEQRQALGADLAERYQQGHSIGSWPRSTAQAKGASGRSCSSRPAVAGAPAGVLAGLHPVDLSSQIVAAGVGSTLTRSAFTLCLLLAAAIVALVLEHGPAAPPAAPRLPRGARRPRRTARRSS